MTAADTILVVEDDPKVLRLTVTRVEELGYKVAAASDGPQAIKILKQGKDIHSVPHSALGDFLLHMASSFLWALRSRLK